MAAMPSGPTTTEAIPSTLANAPPRGHARWWYATAVGMLVSLPLAWLLSYGGPLPFLLGVFFFMLFGLFIGAAVYRVGAPGRPYSRSAVLAGTTLIVGFCWTFSIAKESRDFPADVANDAVRRVRDIGGRSADDYRTAVAAEVRTFLAERHPPGGVLGYVRWMLLEGEIKKGAIPSFDQALRRPQTRWLFAIRVVLSIALLAFTVGSQTFLLAAPRNTKALGV